MTIIIILSVLILMFIVLVCSSGFFLKKTYVLPWNKRYYTNFDDTRLRIVAHGIIAPNSMNLQMWKIKLSEDKNVFYQFADAEKNIISDPNYNDCITCQGTFAEYCVEAAKKLGYELEIVAFPNGPIDENNFIESSKTTPVARYTLIKNNNLVSELYESMFKTHTIRNPFLYKKLSKEDINKLVDSIKDFKEISIQIIDNKNELEEFRDLAYKAKTIEQETDKVVYAYSEITRPNEYLKNKYKYGLSLEAEGVKGLKMQLMQGIATIFPFIAKSSFGRKRELRKIKKALNSTQAFIFLKAQKNRVNQFNTGRAYSRFRLTASKMGIGMQPLSQLNASYKEMEHIKNQFDQKYNTKDIKTIMVLRVGYHREGQINEMRLGLEDFKK